MYALNFNAGVVVELHIITQESRSEESSVEQICRNGSGLSGVSQCRELERDEILT